VEVEMNVKQRCVIILFFLWVYANTQNMFFVTTTDAFDATAFSNSHKIVTQNGEVMNDTIHIVYHSSDSIYYIYSTDEGISWENPSMLSSGIYPGFDIDTYGFRHIVWQQFDPAHGTYEIYYDCLDDYAPPLNISETPANSIFPDVVVDTGLVAHIVWVEDISSYNYIYYRTCYAGALGDTFRLSNYGSTEATYSYPSISIFKPNNRIYALWDCFDPGSYSPYQIHCRYKENNIWSATQTWASYLAMRHSSIDFSHGWDSLSACWEDSSSGNLEAFFYGGNGGGYPTQGRSMYPVISTVGLTWSYLFWQEDSAGHEDIYYHLYYIMQGWHSSGSLRELFNIQEPIRFPNCCGAYLIWTQGNTPPYSIYFTDFEYPIGITTNEHNEKIQLDISPNPFTDKTCIKIPSTKSQTTLKIYNSVGQLIKAFSLPTVYSSIHNTIWDGTDIKGIKVPSGTYFCILELDNEILLKKLVKLK
jgi:hypothetical protein